MTPKPQANRLEEIRDSHTMKLVPMSQRELFWSELEPKIQALITEARIDELKHVDRHTTYYPDGSVPIEAQNRITQLKEKL